MSHGHKHKHNGGTMTNKKSPGILEQMKTVLMNKKYYALLVPIHRACMTYANRIQRKFKCAALCFFGNGTYICRIIDSSHRLNDIAYFDI